MYLRIVGFDRERGDFTLGGFDRYQVRTYEIGSPDDSKFPEFEHGGEVHYFGPERVLPRDAENEDNPAVFRAPVPMKHVTVQNGANGDREHFLLVEGWGYIMDDRNKTIDKL